MSSDYDTPEGGCDDCVYYRARKTVECHKCASERPLTRDECLDDDAED